MLVSEQLIGEREQAENLMRKVMTQQLLGFWRKLCSSFFQRVVPKHQIWNSR